MLDWLVQLVAVGCQWFLDLVSVGASWLWAALDALLGQVAALLVSLVPPDVAVWLNQHPWEDPTWIVYYERISWWVPVGPMLTVVVTVLTIVGLIRFGRWVVACIPTLNL